MGSLEGLREGVVGGRVGPSVPQLLFHQLAGVDPGPGSDLRGRVVGLVRLVWEGWVEGARG